MKVFSFINIEYDHCTFILRMVGCSEKQAKGNIYFNFLSHVFTSSCFIVFGFSPLIEFGLFVCALCPVCPAVAHQGYQVPIQETIVGQHIWSLPCCLRANITFINFDKRVDTLYQLSRAHFSPYLSNSLYFFSVSQKYFALPVLCFNHFGKF